MNVFFLIFILIFCIIALEKPRLISDIIHNLHNIRGIITNILFILPFIAMFLNTNDIINYMSSKTKSKSYNNKQWWADPKQREKFKKKNIRKVSESTKKIVASNQQWKCFMCHNLLDYSYEIDHNVPLFAGGTNEISNLHALCRNCHGKKTILERNNNLYSI